MGDGSACSSGGDRSLAARGFRCHHRRYIATSATEAHADRRPAAHAHHADVPTNSQTNQAALRTNRSAQSQDALIGAAPIANTSALLQRPVLRHDHPFGVMPSTEHILMTKHILRAGRSFASRHSFTGSGGRCGPRFVRPIRGILEPCDDASSQTQNVVAIASAHFAAS